MKTISIIIIIFFLTTLIFAPLSLIHAQDSQQLDLPKTTINPGSFYYSFKRLWEKGMEKLQFSSQSKINFFKSQLKTKLAELNFVVENKLLSEVQRSSERFAYQAGILTEELVKQNKAEDKEKIIREFEQYSKFLEKLRDKYSANSSFWMLVQHDINTLKILSERLK